MIILRWKTTTEWFDRGLGSRPFAAMLLHLELEKWYLTRSLTLFPSLYPAKSTNYSSFMQSVWPSLPPGILSFYFTVCQLPALISNLNISQFAYPSGWSPPTTNALSPCKTAACLERGPGLTLLLGNLRHLGLPCSMKSRGSAHIESRIPEKKSSPPCM